MKPHLGGDQDQQCKISYKTNCKANRTAKRVNLLPNISVRQDSTSSRARTKLSKYG